MAGLRLHYTEIRSQCILVSTTSGAGHADRITFRAEARLYLSFQHVCGQHPESDTGHILMPSVNAANDVDVDRVLS